MSNERSFRRGTTLGLLLRSKRLRSQRIRNYIDRRVRDYGEVPLVSTKLQSEHINSKDSEAVKGYHKALNLHCQR